MHLRAIVAICLSIVPPLLCYDEATGTFGNPILEYLKMDPNHVEYEVVPVLHAIQDRNPENPEPTQIHFKAFGKDYKLSLKPTEGLFKSNGHVPMWAVTRNDSEPDGLHYEEIEEASTDVGDLYQDPATMSSILLHYDSAGQVQVEGSIGSDLIIRSLPVQVLRQVVDDAKGLDDPDSLPDVTSRERRSLRLTNHHVVVKRSSQSMVDKHSDCMLMEPDLFPGRFTAKRSMGARSKRRAPRVIHPEVLSIIDYDHYRVHGGNDAQIKRYFMAFWNAVDLRYKLVTNPEIRLSISGLIISKDRAATPYIEKNIVERDAFDVSAALFDMGKYMYVNRRFPVYDIAIAITKLDMCHKKDGGACNRGTAGFAYVGGACQVNEYLKKVNAVGLVEDSGGFSGIIVAAHEIGHLLGVTHDGSPAPEYLGGPGGSQCSWEDGYIMSDLRHNENGLKWSPCSLASFRYFFDTETAAKCLYNVPRGNAGLSKVLPGTLLSLDEQCQKDRGTKACFQDERVCIQLFCYNPAEDNCLSYRPAAEGSPCGDRKHCINARCVAKR